MNKYTNLRKMFSQSKQDNSFNKKLYDSDIIQTLYERIAELEDRIKQLEDNNNNDKGFKFGI